MVLKALDEEKAAHKLFLCMGYLRLFNDFLYVIKHSIHVAFDDQLISSIAKFTTCHEFGEREVMRKKLKFLWAQFAILLKGKNINLKYLSKEIGIIAETLSYGINVLKTKGN
eukprot:CAMPEP_0116938222 /NCGR_PEP_ID=MMETSP0467-20121206/31984_1 /TAXON_ID=283647 /ORGANISM="Mesodinium pulex, Strain SPMC105" /LENGTH=111 /DNA_ID=CAMNT_0004620213 /DNA_START=336 /DNA_END=671 /DNA_ORIENTATION=-